MDTFLADLNAHGVFSIDTLNILPTYGDLLKWISDSDSLIKEFYSWALKNQVENCCGENTPNCCKDALKDSAGIKSLDRQNANKYVRNDGSNNATAGPEDIDITHAPILSQKVEASHV